MALRNISTKTYSIFQQNKPLYCRFDKAIGLGSGKNSFWIHLHPTTGPKTKYTPGSGARICSTLLKAICKVLGLAQQLLIPLNCWKGQSPSQGGREGKQPCTARNCSQLSSPALPSGDAYPWLQPHMYICREKQILKPTNCDPACTSECKHAA